MRGQKFNDATGAVPQRGRRRCVAARSVPPARLTAYHFQFSPATPP